MRTARTYPSSAVISSPTITSRGRAAFLVLLEIRSSRIRVVTTIAYSLPVRRAGGEQRGNGGDAGERPGFIAGPQAGFLAIRRHGGVHQRERTAHAGDLKPSRGQQHARIAYHASLRARDQRFDVTQRRIEILSLVQPVAVELPQLVLPEHLPAREHQLLELAVRVDQHQR